MDYRVVNEFKEPTSEERTMGMLIYLLSFFTTIIGPLIIWLLKKDESEFINYHGKEYFNFFISYTIYGLISSFLTVILIGLVMIPIFGLMYLIFTLIALFKAHKGEYYRIPLIFRIIK